MGKIFVGLNTESSRSSDKPFEWAVEKTAESTSNLAADAISTIYSAYVSAEKAGAEVPIKTF